MKRPKWVDFKNIFAMRYPVEVPGFERKSIEIVEPFPLASRILMVDGEEIKPDKDGNLIVYNDSEVRLRAALKSVLGDFDIPNLIVYGKEYRGVEKPKIYEWILIAIPVVILLFLDLFNQWLATSLFATYLNFRVIRSGAPIVVKLLLIAVNFALSILFTIAAVLGMYLIIQAARALI